MFARHLVILIFVLQMLAPISAWAQEKDPLSYSLKQWAFVLSMSLLGGVVSFYGKVRRGEVSKFSVTQLVGELSTSAFAGLIAYFVCDWANFPPGLTAALTGICGHMGTRALAMFEGWAERKFGSLMNVNEPDPRR